KSRILVVILGLLLTGFTVLLNEVREGIPILPLAFGMTSYTVGPLLGLMGCAVLGRGTSVGLAVGSLLSFLLVALIRPDLWVLLASAQVPLEWLSFFGTFDPELLSEGKISSLWCYAWTWPVTAFLTFACGLLFASFSRGASGRS
ncbi:MAG: hypothetical protein ACQKBU_06445, partial [Verrucomicrobiales bacterium]